MLTAREHLKRTCELYNVIDALFTETELRYIHMRCIEGKSFKEIAIECGLSRRTMCSIAKRIADKMHKSIIKNGFNSH